MLLEIYDKAIDSLSAAQELRNANSNEFAKHLLAAQKAILAIHAGLKPDEDDVAFNIARLLHFVLVQIEENQISVAIKILGNLRSGFGAIQAEANQLEAKGAIPPVPDSDAFVATA